MGVTIAFWVLAVMTIAAALGVIFQRNVFRSALSLVVCLVSVAGIFVTLQADFLAATQILVYVGAVSIFIILAIMLTQDLSHGNPFNRSIAPALLIVVAFCGLVAWSVVRTPWRISSIAPPETTTTGLAGQLFSQNGFILPLEIAGVLVLAVVIGAIVIAREK